jgi:hypothetical protein
MGCGREDSVQEEDLLLMLRPLGVVACLTSLTLHNMPLVSPRAVLLLQQELPVLKEFTMVDCGMLQAPAVGLTGAVEGGQGDGTGELPVHVRTEQQQWALLKQLILPRLTFNLH